MTIRIGPALAVLTCAATARGDDGRLAIAAGEYVHAAGLDGGSVVIGWREPLGTRIEIVGEAGAAIATTATATDATLTNPSAALRWHTDPQVTLSAAITLPAASRAGPSGAIATAMAEAHRVDPTRWLPGATTLAAAAARTWRRPLGELTIAAGIGYAIRSTGADLPLLHLDLDGAAALTDAIDLRAGFRTTSYLLVDRRGEDFVHALHLGLRWRVRAVAVDAAVVAPVDRRERDADVIAATIAIEVGI